MMRRLAVTLARRLRARSAGERPEPLWPPVLAVLVILALQLTLAENLSVGPDWLAPALEFALLVPLTISAWRRTARESAPRRALNIALIALVNLFNFLSLALLIRELLRGSAGSGTLLLLNAVKLWVTNMLCFALWYWELDRGGPWRRRLKVARHADFLFPQMSAPGVAEPHWVPDFWDYLFVSFTNAAAFSPTDTMPLTGRAKMLMMTQAFISLVTVALVASRAVNILK